MTERRKSPRYAVSNETEVDMVRDTGMLNIQGRVVNISQTGVLLECNCKISDKIREDGFNLHVKKIGSFDTQDMVLKAHIAHLYVENENIRFRLGLKFKKELDSAKWNEIKAGAQLAAS